MNPLSSGGKDGKNSVKFRGISGLKGDKPRIDVLLLKLLKNIGQIGKVKRKKEWG